MKLSSDGVLLCDVLTVRDRCWFTTALENVNTITRIQEKMTYALSHRTKSMHITRSTLISMMAVKIGRITGEGIVRCKVGSRLKSGVYRLL